MGGGMEAMKWENEWERGLGLGLGEREMKWMRNRMEDRRQLGFRRVVWTFEPKSIY